MHLEEIHVTTNDKDKTNNSLAEQVLNAVNSFQLSIVIYSFLIKKIVVGIMSGVLTLKIP